MDGKELVSDLKTLIDTAPSEQKAQAFLEANPILLSVLSYRTPEQDLVISQFPLGADFRADFAFLTFGMTEGLRLHLIEIERPSLRLFTSKDDFTAGANHAFQQLHDWAGWCAGHRESLIHTLAPIIKHTPGGFLGFRTFCFLIAGRRAEVSTSRRQRRLTARANLPGQSFVLHTWDGFLERVEMDIGGHPLRRATVRCVTYRTEGLFEKESARNAVRDV